ncbi:MAG: peptidoglycan-binding protein [bacterium]|nr:peptidoglycan-binding protein [bacterium]
MAVLRIGCCDSGSIADRKGFLSGYHMWNLTSRGFRGERDGKWYGFSEQAGTPVRRLQEKLRAMGFYPFGAVDGIFGYRTQSSVRLFQEFVTVAGGIDLGGVDGMSGPKTQAIIDSWAKAGKKAPWGKPSPEYTQAMAGLRQLKQHFSASRLQGISLLNKDAAGSASRAVADWTFDNSDLHLVGIRRNENKVFIADDGGRPRRMNEDLFILLANGKRLVFRGSTNPNPRVAGRPDQPFILRGQHEFYFAWHKLASLSNPSSTRVYRAFKPCGSGPLIVRAKDNLLSEKSFESVSANNSINIHWSGAGTVNWSAGCQVVAGQKYIDYRNEVVDLTGRAARSYGDLSGSKTRGAYNVLLDALTVFAKDARTSGDRLLYTLLYEKDVQRTKAGELVDFDETIKRLS